MSQFLHRLHWNPRGRPNLGQGREGMVAAGEALFAEDYGRRAGLETREADPVAFDVESGSVFGLFYEEEIAFLMSEGVLREDR